MQHFTCAPAAAPDGGEMVVCCPSGQPVVAASTELWDIIRAARRTGQLAAVGCPVVAAATPPLLSTVVGEVLLDGGDWPPGP
ncbi:hypothetical protein [Dactylosporangium sp. CA-092794]|uniref:hypothetical protein n=1 Tax=Dactylosporangium sp. CA-092794 TaxID=3239929 RepID=UPI003D8AF211